MYLKFNRCRWRLTCRAVFLRTLIFIVAIIFALALNTAQINAANSETQQSKIQLPMMSSIKSKGIVVPKRSGLISGLNDQFTKRRGNSPSNSTSSTPGTVTNSTQQTSSSSSAASGLLAMTQLSSWFNGGSKNSAKDQKLRKRTQSGDQAKSEGSQASGESLYMDKQKQELIASSANSNNKQDEAEQRSSLPSPSIEHPDVLPSTATVQRLMTAETKVDPVTGQLLQGLNAALLQQQQQPWTQSYRGHSLIELEVRNESEKKYVQELYGNLSAALNEQAQRPQSLTVSPYVDIDFWSFKSAINDHIDIMVSPKSRAFILNQLNRANIKHRIKVNDIQSRIDQQLPATGSSGQTSASASTGLSQPANVRATEGSALDITVDAAEGRGLPATGVLSPKVQQHQPQQQQTTGTRLLSGRQSPPSLHSQATTSSNTPHQAESLTSGRSDIYLNDTAFFDNYQRLSDINSYLESIVNRARDVAKVQVIGRSSQGRYLRVLKLGYDQLDIDGSTGVAEHPGDLDIRNEDISKNTIDTSSANESRVASNTTSGPQSQSATSNKPQGNTHTAAQNASHILENFLKRQQSVQKLGSIWLDGGTHAREWISPATVLYIAFRLAENNNRCMRFVDSMRLLVSAAQQATELGARSDANMKVSETLKLAAPAASLNKPDLEEEELEGDEAIDEIVSSDIRPSRTSRALNNFIKTGDSDDLNDLLAEESNVVKSTDRTDAKQRGRLYKGDVEHRLELLAKRPQEVASEHGCDLELEQLLRRYTFYIMPVLNPDGYEYSHTHNRLWRKTRSTSNHPIYRHFCLGADPNRNYDARHGSTGSSVHPCSQTYSGTVPFTEPETKHQSNFVYSHRQQLKMYISFHSYSQMILLPFSHSKQLAPDHKDLESVGQAAVKAIEQTHGTVYRVGPSASILYTASGTASDWAYEKAGIKYSYTIELRDTGTYGFLLPKQQIVPTGEETFNGLLAMIGQMEKNDNLLTSKSYTTAPGGKHGNSLQQQQQSQAQQYQKPTNASMSNGPYLHAPNFESSSRRQPILENVLDHSSNWPTSSLSGVRDRPATRPVGLDRTTAAALAHQSGFRLDDDETIASNADEPDAGYAFEGEGELMEPTNKLSEAANNARSIAETARNLSRRQSHHLDPPSLRMTSNGRNLINSPPLPSRTTPAIPRRELSQEHRPSNEPSI